MAEQFPSLLDEHRQFIEAQRIFFAGTAAQDGRVNVSPKGYDCLRVLNPDRLLWMNLTGSGNETAAHLRQVNRITLMWCAFEGPPLILRVYGRGRSVHTQDSEWSEFAQLIEPSVGARQFVVVDIDMVQTSCGYGVPLLDYQEDRNALLLWAEKRGMTGVADYWAERNTLSLDGQPTGMAPAGD